MQITINKEVYGIGNLDALRQFHVSRRIAPILASMGVSLSSLRQGATIKAEDIAFSLGPVSEVLAAMSDEHTEYILATCLSVVTRRQGTDMKPTWAPVARGAQPMFMDIDMSIMLRLVVAVLQENLMGFLKEPDEQATSPGS